MEFPECATCKNNKLLLRLSYTFYDQRTEQSAEQNRSCMALPDFNSDKFLKAIKKIISERV